VQGAAHGWPWTRECERCLTGPRTRPGARSDPVR
jgi:hypothetical protein